VAMVASSLAMRPHLAPANGASGRYSEFRDPQPDANSGWHREL